MTKYALTKDDATIAEIRDFEARPPDPIGKGWKWLPFVQEEIAHDERGKDVVDVPSDLATRYVPGSRPLTSREQRALAYIEEVGPDPEPIKTIGDMLDVVIRELRAIRAGDAETREFTATVAKIDDIKARFPKA